MKKVKNILNDKNLIIEVNILSKLNNKYIIKLYDSFILYDKLFLILENGKQDLSKFILNLSNNNIILSEYIYYKIFTQLCEAIFYLKENKIIHRDIKPNNIFIDDNYNIKVGDFGISKIMETNQKYTNTLLGSPFYISPEICQGISYNYKSDVWGIGVTMYELIFKKKCFYEKNISLIISSIINKNITFKSELISIEFSKLLEKTLIKNIKDRPDVEYFLDNKLDIKQKLNINLSKKNIKQNILNVKKIKTISKNVSNNISINKGKKERKRRNKTLIENKVNKTLTNIDKNIITPTTIFKDKSKPKSEVKKELFKSKNIKRKNLKLPDKLFDIKNINESRKINIEMFLKSKIGKENFYRILNLFNKGCSTSDINKALGKEHQDLYQMFLYIKVGNTPSTANTNYKKYNSKSPLSLIKLK